ncbi:unnamed protein product [Rotaria sordida]|uniref:Uncharacterized protein n=1 Tax=Rotaria sordida TaxID=392033 RepID=A0A819SJN4_9BILA|nr:unnamed protein product [Rotaria sordida]
MSTDHDFSRDAKQIMFYVIKFVEHEKGGCLIPLNNKKLDQEKQDNEDAAIRATLRLRNPRTRSSSSSVIAESNSTLTTFMPVAKSSRKRGHFGRPPISWTENPKENIR